jgi:hypothetical protein
LTTGLIEAKRVILCGIGANAIPLGSVVHRQLAIGTPIFPTPLVYDQFCENNAPASSVRIHDRFVPAKRGLTARIGRMPADGLAPVATEHFH